MRIAVAGGTGVLGRHVVRLAREGGHEPVVLSRSRGVDLREGGESLTAALAGCDAVVDVASVQTLSAKESTRFFRAVTENLIRAEITAGVRHHVAVSIVGALAIDDGYYAGKALQERLVTASGTGWTMLRATQFHEFAAQTAQTGRMLGVHLVPQMRSQPVAAAEVAAEVVALATGAPRGLVADLAGPRQESMPDLVRRFVRASGSRRPVLSLPLPGRMGRGLRDGTILPREGARLGTQTFDQWLAESQGAGAAR
ncbi:NAD(P)H-binding protein [Microbacterium sp. NPDC096154]|uniref:SDR family oxidoreductase n=1 Tax=Microbacterium sp. NPDC096154 TaxID=3155549 RepID=UPI003327F29A